MQDRAFKIDRATNGLGDMVKKKRERGYEYPPPPPPPVG